MINTKLLQATLARQNLNIYRLSKKAKVDPKTAKNVVMFGIGNPDSVYLIAKALGFDVRPNDISAILKKEMKTA